MTCFKHVCSFSVANMPIICKPRATLPFNAHSTKFGVYVVSESSGRRDGGGKGLLGWGGGEGAGGGGDGNGGCGYCGGEGLLGGGEGAGGLDII